MRVMLIGAGGQLGSDLQKALRLQGDEVVALTHAEIEVTAAQSIAAALENHQPEVVINTAAYHKVDEMEGYPEKALAVNAIGPMLLAKACARAGATLLHYSSDYVFGGDLGRAYGESDLPNPGTVYGASKLAGEHLIAAYLPRHFIVRTTGLYGIAGSSGKGGNFVELMLRLARERDVVTVVNDQIMTPTYTPDLARKTVELIRSEAYGLYHVTSAGQCSWYDFAAAIYELTDTPANLQPTTTAAFGAPARRPAYSVLRHDNLQRLGMDDLRHWRDALAAYLEERKARQA